ncbi:RGCVC family protein [Amycolatopsis sp. NPDC051071]|uniref:RGCVC family protein n=1 Tax=Amycolatopsis sp. NPDC051071 TaxID=3154637 RepID=UPI003426AE1F
MTAARSLGDVAEPAADDRCPSCPHPLSAHDAIARRFCTATAAGGFSRGCTCATKPEPTTE